MICSIVFKLFSKGVIFVLLRNIVFSSRLFMSLTNTHQAFLLAPGAFRTFAF